MTVAALFGEPTAQKVQESQILPLPSISISDRHSTKVSFCKFWQLIGNATVPEAEHYKSCSHGYGRCCSFVISPNLMELCRRVIWRHRTWVMGTWFVVTGTACGWHKIRGNEGWSQLICDGQSRVFALWKIFIGNSCWTSSEKAGAGVVALLHSLVWWMCRFHNMTPQCYRWVGERLGRNRVSKQYVSGQSDLTFLPAPPARRALDCK